MEKDEKNGLHRRVWLPSLTLSEYMVRLKKEMLFFSFVP